MKTTIESYQNQAKNLQDLTNLQLDDLYSSVYTLIGEAIENDDLESHDKILPILRAIKKEIQDRNEVTPTTTEDKTNIETIKIQIQNKIDNLKIQINKVVRIRKRNHLIGDYLFFLCDLEKITLKKFRKISNIKKEKRDTLRRVHELLIYERNRLNKVA